MPLRRAVECGCNHRRSMAAEAQRRASVSWWSYSSGGLKDVREYGQRSPSVTASGGCLVRVQMGDELLHPSQICRENRADLAGLEQRLATNVPHDARERR